MVVKTVLKRKAKMVAGYQTQLLCVNIDTLTGEGARKLQVKLLTRCLISTSKCQLHS